jgi:NADH:ubiquinone oxidoreductase subunit 2 (subunit N)
MKIVDSALSLRFKISLRPLLFWTPEDYSENVSITLNVIAAFCKKLPNI